MAPAAAIAHRWSGGVGSMRRRDGLDAGDAGGDEDGEDDEQAGAAFGALGAQQNAMPSGTAVRASPKLWMRSASSATEPESAKMSVCATAVTPRTASERSTARMPSRERLMESWTRPCECPCSLGVPWPCAWSWS